MGTGGLVGLKRLDRSLHLLDVENLGHGSQCTGTGLAKALRRFRVVADWEDRDLAVGAASNWFFKRVRFDLPVGLRLLPAGGGDDAADLRLIGEVDPEWIAARFRRVVVGSGDHIFADVAHRLSNLGVTTWAVSWRDAMSWDLAKAVDEVRYLDDDQPTRGQVAA